MARFNRIGVAQVGPRSPIKSTGEVVVGHEGHEGYARDAKSELFLLAASFMGGDDNFYERSNDRYERLIHLIGQHEVYGDPEWVYQFVKWLRNDANMRTVSMVVAIEAVRYRVLANATDPFPGGVIDHVNSTYAGLTNRNIVSAALQRADEPAEALAYWLAKYGKPIIQPVKNGVKDAAERLYDEFSYLKYGKSRSATVSMLDVLRITRVSPKDDEQNRLFDFITGDYPVPPIELPMLSARAKLYAMPQEERRPFIEATLGSGKNVTLKEAGFTWENLSEWIPGGMDAKAWEAIIPNMGIMALIRNLRNFDQAGISREMRALVIAKISNPDVVRKSKQLPFRWYNAYRAVESLHYASALEEALNMSLDNIPKFSGKTLVLVDMSGSMFMGTVSDKSNVTYANAASLFGATLKIANPSGVDLYQFGSELTQLRSGFQNQLGLPFGMPGKEWTGVTKRIDLSAGSSILRGMERFFDMGGTQTHQAVIETFRREHNRVIILTDEQSWSSTYVMNNDLPVPANTPLYIWNLAGYRSGLTRSGSHNRHVFGGLSDSAFKLIPILEAGRNGVWPWEIREENGQAPKG